LCRFMQPIVENEEEVFDLCNTVKNEMINVMCNNLEANLHAKIQTASRTRH
jgi:RAB protein geranylgeranyltransferase component A